MNAIEQSQTYQAFLKDVRAHPSDNAPKLILADWLEEQGHAKTADSTRRQWADYDGKPTPEWAFLVHPWDFTAVDKNKLLRYRGRDIRDVALRDMLVTCKDHADVFRCFEPGVVARFTTVALPTDLDPRGTASVGIHDRRASHRHGRWLVGGLAEVRYLFADGLLQDGGLVENHLIVPVARVRRVLFNRDREFTNGVDYVIEIEWPDPFRELTPAELIDYQNEHDRMYGTP